MVFEYEDWYEGESYEGIDSARKRCFLTWRVVQLISGLGSSVVSVESLTMSVPGVYLSASDGPPVIAI
jgi:hypothetical protein